MAQMNDKALEELTVDYGERPSMEPLEGVTDEHRKAGSHLAAIHRMHLRDVYYIGKLLEQVKDGSINPSNLSGLWPPEEPQHPSGDLSASVASNV